MTNHLTSTEECNFIYTFIYGAIFGSLLSTFSILSTLVIKSLIKKTSNSQQKNECNNDSASDLKSPLDKSHFKFIKSHSTFYLSKDPRTLADLKVHPIKRANSASTISFVPR
jgi:hypothetical protein